MKYLLLLVCITLLITPVLADADVLYIKTTFGSPSYYLIDYGVGTTAYLFNYSINSSSTLIANQTWIVLGSNDTYVSDAVDTQNNIDFTAEQTKNFTVTTPAYYRFYYLIFTSGFYDPSTILTLTLYSIPGNQPVTIPVVAQFDASPRTGNASLNVSFTDLSDGYPTSWNWTFGDGGNSSLQNPYRVYKSHGTYTVRLVANNTLSSNTTVKTGFISIGQPFSQVVSQFDAAPKIPTTTTMGLNRIYIPKTGTIKVAEIFAYATTAGTAETWGMDISNNSDTGRTNMIQNITVTATTRRWTNNTMNTPVVYGDYIEIRSRCPPWATNPAALIFSGNIYIE